MRNSHKRVTELIKRSDASSRVFQLSRLPAGKVSIVLDDRFVNRATGELLFGVMSDFLLGSTSRDFGLECEVEVDLPDSCVKTIVLGTINDFYAYSERFLDADIKFMRVHITEINLDLIFSSIDEGVYGSWVAVVDNKRVPLSFVPLESYLDD